MLEITRNPLREKNHRVDSVRKVVIIGGVAAGPKAASKIARLDPRAEVTVVEKGEFLSYAGCGLPYYISGTVQERRKLMLAPGGGVRDPAFFKKVKNVRVLNRTEAMEIDRASKRVRARDVESATESWLAYDSLVLATGAIPVIPPLPGIDLDNVFTLHGVPDAEGIKASLGGGKTQHAVIIGGGLIGVEAAEALVEKGCRVTLVEMLPQVLGILDWEMAKRVQRHIESHGVRVHTDTRVTAIEGEGRVTAVATDKGRLPADIVIVCVGVRPNVALARAAGLVIGDTGAIKVNDHMQTSDPHVYAVGDCVENRHLVTGKPCFVPLGSTANKQGRVAAINICGGDDTFPGVLGSTVCKVFEYCVARTGLTESACHSEGHQVETVLVPGADKAHYMPTAKGLTVKLVVDRESRRLLGAQAIGPGDGSKRIDVAAMAITTGMTVDQLAKTDLCYAPPYSPAMDNIITAADVARNKLNGDMIGITPMEVREMQERTHDFILLDVRSPAEWQKVRLAGAVNIPIDALRNRLGELDRDKEIVVFCNVSLRAYEASLILRAAGFQNVRVMDGSIAMWPYEREA